MKPQKPGIAFFAAQFNNLLVGPNNVFKTFGDLCRWANQEIGITGVSLPDFMLNIPELLKNSDYRESFAAEFTNLGTPIVRFESHVIGQLMCVHPAMLPRWKNFIPRELHGKPAEAVEEWARRKMFEMMELSRLFGFEDHQTFIGGRSVPIATDPWPSHANSLYEVTLALLAEKWESTLLAAADRHVRIGFENRHIMEDIATVQQLLDFRDMLDPRAAPAANWGVDISHYEIEGDTPFYDVELALQHDMNSPGHAKQGYYDSGLPGGCVRPANMPWSTRAGKFCTFGTRNPANSRLWVRSLLHAHNRSERGVFAIIEGECMFLRNPKQGLKIAAQNLRRVFDGMDPIELVEIQPEPWDGPAFDKFADTGMEATELLCIQGADVSGVRDRIERYRAAIG